MAYLFTNPNPENNLVGDCVIRAIALATNSNWYKIYTDLCIQGFEMADMPSSNRVWMEYLKEQGWHRHNIPDTCPGCYTVKDFCGEYFSGTYILGTGTHLIAVKNGDWMDTWDSFAEQPIFYWSKGEDDE